MREELAGTTYPREPLSLWSGEIQLGVWIGSALVLSALLLLLFISAMRAIKQTKQIRAHNNQRGKKE